VGIAQNIVAIGNYVESHPLAQSQVRARKVLGKPFAEPLHHPLISNRVDAVAPVYLAGCASTHRIALAG